MKVFVPLFVAAQIALVAAGTPSTLALSSSPNASVYGLPVTLIASVSPATSTGNVTFYDGTTVLGTAKLAAGQAVLTTILLPSGVRSLRAYYGGDTNFAPGTSANLTQNVSAAPGGGFHAAVSYGAGIDAYSVAVGDFNGDGKADLAVANNGGNNVSVLLGNGDGTFRSAANYRAGLGSVAVAVGDFNGDGNADLAVSDYQGSNVSVLLGNGDGSFRAAVTYGAGSGPISIAVGDFNGDGKADLAVANSGRNNISVLLGNGDGTFQAALSYGAGSSPNSIAVADFNGDGKADLAVANYEDNNVSVLRGNGDGTFGTATNYGVGYGPESIAVADFNGDGAPDIVVGNFDYNVSVLLGEGDGTFKGAVGYPVEGFAFAVAVGDFNGDGNADIAAANNEGNNVSVLLGKGDGTFFPPEANYGAGVAPNAITAADFNGNGRADLVAADSGGRGVSVLLATAPFPELLTVVTHSGSFVQGQSAAIYTITVSNVGSGPTTGMVTVTDSLPPGVTASGIEGAGWTCTLTTLTCTREDSLVTASSYPVITLAVTVGTGAPGGITNMVQVSGGAQTNIANGAASDFTTTFTAGQVAQAWAPLNPPASKNGYGAALLMTDGTVLINQNCSGNWYKLA